MAVAMGRWTDNLVIFIGPLSEDETEAAARPLLFDRI
jgi:hypothetical protein